MNNISTSSKIEQDFIKQCLEINKHINPYLFLKKYNSFSNDYINFYEDDLVDLGKMLNSVFPNVEWSLAGRVKSKYSFCKKTSQKLSKSFNYDDLENPKESKKIEKNISHILSFFDNSTFLQEILKDKSLNSQTKMDMIISHLSDMDKARFILHLGMSDDIFAHRLIVRSIGHSICNTTKRGNTLFITDESGTEIPIQPAIKIKNEEIIKHIEKTLDKETSDYSMVEIKINGKKEQINLDYIEKNEDGSIKYNEDNSITLFRDSIQMQDGSIINVTPNSLFYVEGNTYLKTPSDGLKNINSLVLRKYDEPSISKGISKIMSYIQTNYLALEPENTEEFFEIPPERYKDYISTPKSTGYKSIHATFLKKWYNEKKQKYITKYSQEIQAESLTMDKDKDDPNSPLSHNRYKSSADELSQLMIDPQYALSELFPTYILVTSFNINGKKEVFSHRADLKTSIQHIIPKTDYNKLIQERNSNDLELDNSTTFSDDSFDFFDL